MSGLTADALRVPVTDADRAGEFYAQALGAKITEPDLITSAELRTVDLHGTGTIELTPSETPLPSRFGRIVVTYVLDQPSAPTALMDAAAEPRPTETGLILGVREPKVSRAFYVALGMEPDRDYGTKYIDFQPAPGRTRLCLMQSPVLAKDVGILDSSEQPTVTFVHRARSLDEVERLADSAATAGGRTLPAQSGEEPIMIDPDGFPLDPDEPPVITTFMPPLPSRPGRREHP